MVKRRRGQRDYLAALTFHKLDWLEIMALVVGGWFLFFPQPYIVFFSMVLVIPIVGLLICGLSGRPSIATLVRVKTDRNGHDAYDVADFLDVPAFVLLLRVLMDFQFEKWQSLLIPGSVACILMIVFLFGTHKSVEGVSRRRKAWIYVSLILNVTIYSYAATYGMNCVYDSSEPKVYQTEVIGKNVHTSRGRISYYVTVNPWGQHNQSEDLRVTSARYREIAIGSPINIDVKEGLFGIPWLYVE